MRKYERDVHREEAMFASALQFIGLRRRWGAHGRCALRRGPGRRLREVCYHRRAKGAFDHAVDDHRMPKPLLLGIVAVIVAGCAGLQAASDRALCTAGPTDQVERQAAREICR